MEAAFIEYELTVAAEPTTIVSGCAHGVDSLWAETAAIRYPNALIRLIIPAAPHNSDLVHFMRHNHRQRLEILQMPEARNNPDAYMQRNDQVQHEADVLQAFPIQPTEAVRSGTWATIRRFRKAGKMRYILPCVAGAVGYWE